MRAHREGRLQLQFHILSFEGPDAYARAGGLASRVDGLAHSLACLGYDSHVWFVGDPDLPGHEDHETLHLHRWCQWISQYHRGGVYDGEEGKHADYGRSLPPHLFEHSLLPHLKSGGHAVVMAEEWQTVDAILHLDWLLREAGLRDRVSLLWNANNYFGFERIDFGRLKAAATLTTVSRYMKHLMHGLGVDPVVIHNGLPADAFDPPCADGVAELRSRLAQRTVLFKMARFDPDKRWLMAIDIVHELKREGYRPLLIARGGVEAHGREVFERINAHGLRAVERTAAGTGIRAVLASLENVEGADVVSLRSFIEPETRRVLLRGADAVLANSGHEPFGLVGLETMAAGGLACTGISGEDYAVPGRNALVVQTAEPREFVELWRWLRKRPREERAMRRAGKRTALTFEWSEVIRRLLLPRLSHGDAVDMSSNGDALTASEIAP